MTDYHSFDFTQLKYRLQYILDSLVSCKNELDEVLIKLISINQSNMDTLNKQNINEAIKTIKKVINKISSNEV